jgi:exonuclease III
MGLTKPANYPTLHTYHQEQTSSQIDYILVKKNEDTCVPNIIQLVKVRDDPQNTSDHFPVTTTLYACPKKKPATCDSIPKLKIDWDKVDKEEYKKKVLVELEDFRYLKMKTPYGVEQSITHFINSIQKAINLCCPQNQAIFRRRKKYSWTPKLSEAVAKSKRTFTYGKRQDPHKVVIISTK